ncbi:hypothetical protein ITI46_33995 [Streptomyces oryzae]|uniref:Uncharacterized protein n=1 Tax=Streptomyces oryzae TaxID=1434886 RepID=A0ABS3XMP7_9ACTN|nr:hypothetical protein [Streptomyces oryzae]MBO8196606.1 hypothetical protein [Streptomyces oryzae]
MQAPEQAGPERQSLVLGVERLTRIQDRYAERLASDNQGSSGDAPWPGGDGNLSDH